MYERPHNISAEKEIISQLVQIWRCDPEPIKLPIKLHLDYLLTRNGLPGALVEIKDRTNARAAYPTAIISLHKLIEGRMMAGNLGVPFLLVYRWTDALGYLQVGDLGRYVVETGGTKKRGDPQDIEPQVYIPIEEFKLLPFVG
jgi:hypothetical protein